MFDYKVLYWRLEDGCWALSDGKQDLACIVASPGAPDLKPEQAAALLAVKIVWPVANVLDAFVVTASGQARA